MLLTLIPIIINMLIGIILWGADISVIIKVIGTLLLMIKYMLFLIAVFNFSEKRHSRIGFIICTALNVLGIVFSAVYYLWHMVALFALLLILFGIWIYGSLLALMKGGDES